MLLKTVHIGNYKSIDDSNDFTILPVTCLVGKNEAGKSAILEALYKLNPVVDAAGEFTEMDYPRRRLADYKEQHGDEADNVLTTTWELSQDDMKALYEVVGNKSGFQATITIRRGYDNENTYEFVTNETEVVRYYIRSAKLAKDDPSKFDGVETIAALGEALQGLTAPTDGESALLVRIQAAFPNDDVNSAVIHAIEALLPKFVYFTSYNRLPGEVALSELQQHVQAGQLTEEDRVFIALLDLVNTTPEGLANITQSEPLIAELEGVSNRISQEIFKYWSQNRHLEVQFRFDAARTGDPPPFNAGYIFRTRIRNNRHLVTVSFDERSTGFVWFFSFLVWFSQVRKIYGERLLILLDEPALSLHARAQADLLRYINERLMPNYQVIYTTHSPFMVDPENLLAVRTVEDVTTEEEVLGTKVEDSVLSTDKDTVFPLQAALGYEITQTLFVGKDTLLVEGPSDLLYLKWFSRQLSTRGRTSLDKRWTITPCGGVDKVAAFMSLFGANQLHVAVFADFTHGIKAKVRSLRESELLQAGHVLSADSYAGQVEADIEDVMGRELYISLVNNCYGLSVKRKVPDAKSKDAPARVLIEVQDHFRGLPSGISEFDHYAPASFLAENEAEMAKSLPNLDASLDRFEKLFKDLNALLDQDAS